MNRSQCDAIRPLISAALDGELDEDEFVLLSEHLVSCSSCRQVHQDYQQLRDDLRSVTSPAPPPQLSRTVRKETVEKPPPPKIVQFASRAGLRFGISTVAASIVLLVVVAFFGFQGYDQRSIPAVTASSPAQESQRVWPINRPIEIEFTKRMNQQSVEENLLMQPASEKDRLPTNWDGNTLIIGRSDQHSVLLRHETDYRITILPQAEDRHGNPIGDFWILEFRTGPRHVAVDTPTSDDESHEEESRASDDQSDDSWPLSQETPEPSQDDRDSATQEESSDQDSGSQEASSDQESSRSDDSGDPEGQSEPTPTEPDGTNGRAEATPEEPTEEPTEEPVEPTPTSEPEPASTATPNPTSTATPDPTSTPTPEPTEQAEPDRTSTPTAEPIPVRDAFGEVYWGNEDIENALGKPTQEARAFLGSEQEFQRGLMFHLQFLDPRRSIFVFVNDGTVEVLNNTYNREEHDYPGEDLGDGLYAPSGLFGKIWSENSDLADEIGHSTTRDAVDGIDAAIQQFDGGQMIYSRGMVYVIFEDSQWSAFPVSSGPSGGYQGEDRTDDEDGSQDDESTVESDSGDDASGEDEPDHSGDAENIPEDEDGEDTDNGQEDEQSEESQ